MTNNNKLSQSTELIGPWHKFNKLNQSTETIGLWLTRKNQPIHWDKQEPTVQLKHRNQWMMKKNIKNLSHSVSVHFRSAKCRHHATLLSNWALKSCLRFLMKAIPQVAWTLKLRLAGHAGQPFDQYHHSQPSCWHHGTRFQQLMVGSTLSKCMFKREMYGKKCIFNGRWPESVG